MDKYLYWTDRYNSPRFLNIDWAIDYKKQKKWEIQQVDNDILNFNILNFKHNGVSVSLFTGNNGTLLASNQLISEYFEVENCDCSIILKEKFLGLVIFPRLHHNYALWHKTFTQNHTMKDR